MRMLIACCCAAVACAPSVPYDPPPQPPPPVESGPAPEIPDGGAPVPVPDGGGFEVTPQPAWTLCNGRDGGAYAVEDLSVLGPLTSVRAISPAGKMVGSWTIPQTNPGIPATHDWMRDGATWRDFGGSGCAGGSAQSINDAGDVAGTCFQTWTGFWRARRRLAREQWRSEMFDPTSAVKSTAAGIALGGTVALATAGAATLWYPDGTTGALRPDFTPDAMGPNLAIGGTDSRGGVIWSPFFPGGIAQLQPQAARVRGLRWENLAAGSAVVDGVRHAFRFESGGGAVDLDPTPATSEALAINARGDSVGVADDGTGPRAMLFRAGQRAQRLSDLIDADVSLEEAAGIDDDGRIVANGRCAGMQHAFLLTPRVAGARRD